MTHTLSGQDMGTAPPPARAQPERPAEPDRPGALEELLEERVARRDGWTLSIFALAAAALLAAVMAVGFGMRAIDQAQRNPSATTTGAASASAPAPETAMVHLREFAIEPKEVTVATGGTLQVMNTGAMTHNLAVKGTSITTPMIDAGGTASLSLSGLSAGTYTLYCEVPGHEQLGMVATLKVGGPASPSASAATPSSPSTSEAGAKLDPNAMPGPTWRAFDPTLKPGDGATVRNIAFHVTEKVLEVAPGVTQEMWTFNGQVPGPVLRGHVGDVFNVTLVNDGTMGHSIDFHASQVAPNVAMRTLQPGQSLVYQFKADYAGIWMYHCGTTPALAHIGNGMYGAVVIDPPNLAAVDHEYVMVQSELYLGPQGKPGDFAKMAAATPDGVVFNGYFDQYKFAPIRVQPSERIRVWLLDVGPNIDSSFHVVGAIFDTVFKEGRYELQPGNPTHGGSQALDLQPAQGGFVEFSLAQPGLYTMITHRFADVAKGALGTFQAGDVSGTMSH